QRRNDGYDSPIAIEHGRAGGTVIEDETIIPIVHLKECRTGEFVTVPILYEAAARDPQLAVGIGEAHEALLRDERLCSALKDDRIGNCGSQLEHGDFLGVVAGEMTKASRNRGLGFSILHLHVFPLLILS